MERGGWPDLEGEDGPEFQNWESQQAESSQLLKTAGQQS